MKVSDYIVSFLEEKGVNVIFGYIGGMITHLVDSIDKIQIFNLFKLTMNRQQLLLPKAMHWKVVSLE